MLEKEQRHIFLALQEELSILNERLKRELIQVDARPIGGADATLKRVREIQQKINQKSAEYLTAISNIVSYSIH